MSFSQALAAFIAGCDAAWGFFGGVFKVMVPDNASPIVADADAVNPRFTAELALNTPSTAGSPLTPRGSLAERQAGGTGRAIRARELLEARRGLPRPG